MINWDMLRQSCPRLYKHGVAFECGPGWYNILHDLSIKIEAFLDKYAETYKVVESEESEYCEIYAVQVKEKYGTLRFYMSCETDEISELIHECEALSSQTCENCGDLAKMRGKTWLSVRCEKCHKENK